MLIIKAKLRTTKESTYAAGNMTEKLVDIVSNVGVAVNRGTELVTGGELAMALGRLACKTIKYLAHGDNVCIGLCLVPGTYETISLKLVSLIFV